MKDNALAASSGQIYRLAVGLFRFCGYLREPALAAALRTQAVKLAEATTVTHDPAGVRAALRGIERLVRFGHDAGEIGAGDFHTLEGALRTCRESIAAAKKEEGARFRLDDVLLPATRSLPQPPQQEQSGNPAQALPDTLPHPANDAQENDRKKLIVARIRQSGNARLRDIQNSLPDVSERTLRYTLRRLVEEGKIQRVGNGGAGNYYRTADQAPSGQV